MGHKLAQTGESSVLSKSVVIKSKYVEIPLIICEIAVSLTGFLASRC